MRTWGLTFTTPGTVQVTKKKFKNAFVVQLANYSCKIFSHATHFLMKNFNCVFDFMHAIHEVKSVGGKSY